MYDAGLRGRLPMSIREYLKDRPISGTVGNCESGNEIQQNGVRINSYTTCAASQ